MPSTVTPQILPFLEAIEFWKKRLVLASSIYTQLDKEVKKRAFSVAGINNLDELQTVYNAIQESVSHGLPFIEFQDKIADVMEAHGWTYPNNWRVKNIYRTNLQMAYNAGRYKQMAEENATRPYRMYVAIIDEKSRPNHAALDGMVFRYDDPIWEHMKPMNGYG